MWFVYLLLFIFVLTVPLTGPVGGIIIIALYLFAVLDPGPKDKEDE